MVDSNKWSGKDIITFLEIFQNYPCLWDASCADYINRNAKDSAYKELLLKLEERGLKADLAPLKKKIKSLRDTYRNEVYKIKKSKKSGAGADDVYKPRLVWFSAAQMFWSSSIVGRDSSSNLDHITEMAMQNEDYDSPSEDTEDVLLDEPPAITSVKINTPSFSKRNKYSTPSASGNKAAKRSPEKMLPPSNHLKHIKTTSGSKKPQTRFEKSVDKLHDISKLAAENEDQFDKYGKYIASQLREMPLRSFIALQSKINTLITTERLLCLDNEQGQSSMQQRSQSPYSSGSCCSTPHPLMSPYSGSSCSQMSPFSHISSGQTPGIFHQDDIGGLDILSQAMVGMCDAGTHHADLNN